MSEMDSTSNPSRDRAKQARENLQTGARRFSYRFKHDFLNSDRVIIGVALALCLILTSSAISALSRNWELSQRYEERKRELSVLRLEVDNLELENEYYRSEEYQELAARAKQNKMLPGETLVYLPDNTDYAREKHQVVEIAEESNVSNFRQWISFLFGV